MVYLMRPVVDPWECPDVIVSSEPVGLSEWPQNLRWLLMLVVESS